jgi:hypothetical protein
MAPQMQKEKKASSSAAGIIVTALLLAACLYIVVQMYSILHHTYKTETAIAYTMSDSVDVEGVAVFTAEDVAGNGKLGYLVADGERVTNGTVLAEEYTEDSQGTMREQLTNLDESISLLQKSQNSAGSDLSLLSAQSASALYDLLDQLDTRNYSGIDSVKQQFLLSQNRLQVSTGQASDFASTIAALQTQRDQLAGQLGTLNQIVADTNGYFISAANAVFLTSDADTIANASPADFEGMLKQNLETRRDDLAGRVITSFSWKFYAVCTPEEAARFDGVTNVKISVPGKEDDPLSATVAAVQVDEASGTAKIEFDCQNTNAAVLTLGQEEAQIDLQTYDGIRIDRKALHIVDGNKGVYVKYGNLERFRRISVLYENENYILVPKNGALGTENEVRLYDEVIVEGTNLADGKLL